MSLGKGGQHENRYCLEVASRRRRKRGRGRKRGVTHQKSPFCLHEVDWTGGEIGDSFSQTLITHWITGVSPSSVGYGRMHGWIRRRGSLTPRLSLRNPCHVMDQLNVQTNKQYLLIRRHGSGKGQPSREAGGRVGPWRKMMLEPN